jgi:hypothetical protein
MHKALLDKIILIEVRSYISGEVRLRDVTGSHMGQILA